MLYEAAGIARFRQRIDRPRDMDPLELVKLNLLVNRTSGRAEIVIGLLDGPVALEHPDLVRENIRPVGEAGRAACAQSDSIACQHGTFVAGILCAARGSTAPALCSGCTLLVRPIFGETTTANSSMPSATPEDLAAAIIDCIEAGARVLNLSLALAQPSSGSHRRLQDALDYATRRGVIVVAAAGNQGTLGSSAITRHPWVIPVVGYDLQGRPLAMSNFGESIGRRGLGAAGADVTSLGVDTQPMMMGGTSVAAPFVTGAAALLWSEFPTATAGEIKLAMTHATRRRAVIVPPLLDAWAAYQAMKKEKT